MLIRYSLLLTVLLCGCAKTVYVPTDCPHSTLPPEPSYTVQDLRQNDSPDKVAKAYVASLYVCKMDNQNLRELLEVYK